MLFVSPMLVITRFHLSSPVPQRAPDAQRAAVTPRRHRHAAGAASEEQQLALHGKTPFARLRDTAAARKRSRKHDGVSVLRDLR